MTNPVYCETNEFHCEQQDEFAVLTLKKGAFDVLTNLEAKNDFFSSLQTIDGAADIKGVALINSDEYPGDEKYCQFLEQIMGDEESSSYRTGMMVFRLRNAIAQLTLLAVRFSKPMVAGVQGEITGEFFGTILPYDFRFATDDTVLMFPSVRFGFPPSGALAFYLMRYVGQAKATEILLLGNSLVASEAQSLGVLTEVVTQDDLLARCLEQLRTVNNAPSIALSTTRRLLHTEAAEIEDYLERSNDLSRNALWRMGKMGHI